MSGGPLSSAAHDVLAERHRQFVDEGYFFKRDDGYTLGQLALAAAAYAAYAAGRSDGSGVVMSLALRLWPWAPHLMKQATDQRRMLVKAGALILAEIERLDRKAAVQ